jgi:hypothetical protein
MILINIFCKLLCSLVLPNSAAVFPKNLLQKLIQVLDKIIVYLLLLIRFLSNYIEIKKTYVFAPVNSTVPSTSPLTTVEPIFAESPLYIVTGKDSPVNPD